MMADKESLLLGVDGGQTATKTVLATQEGKILAMAITGPCNHIHEAGGRERQYRSLRSGYEQVFEKINAEPSVLRSAYLGVSGHGDLGIVQEAIPALTLDVKSDLVNTFIGAIPEFVGVSVAGGTGSVSFGRNERGETCRVGGWGYLLGDEGSAYDISIKAFRAITQAADGRGQKTLLTDYIVSHFDCDDTKVLYKKIYKEQYSRAELWQTAVYVTKAARQGDKVALDILQYAGQQLANLAIAVMKNLQMENQAVKVASVGGVFKAGTLIKDPFQEAIRRINPQATLVEPRFHPAVGSVILALKQTGKEPDADFYQQINETYSIIEESI